MFNPFQILRQQTTPFKIIILDPFIYRNSDALAKVVHNHQSPDFIIKYTDKEDKEDDEHRDKKQKMRENLAGL